MTQVPTTFIDFAGRILSHGQSNGSVDEVTGAMEQGCQALRGRLAPLVGSAAFDALMGRAVNLAARNFAFLDDTPIGANCSADGLRQAAEGREQREVTDAVAAILANFIWLLVIFIGENLGLRMVHEIWPGVPVPVWGHSTEEAEP